MSAQVIIKYILVVSNLLLILLSIIGIILSYFFLTPQIFHHSHFESLNIHLGLATLGFVSWGIALIVASICFIGIVFTRIICLHLIAALILCCPLALSAWLIVEQFLYQSEPNYNMIGICLAGAIIWFIQVFCELILACFICCSSGESDAEKGKEKSKQKEEVGTDEEKEKLVLMMEECPKNRPPSMIEKDDRDPHDNPEEENEDQQEHAREKNEIGNKCFAGGGGGKESKLDDCKDVLFKPLHVQAAIQQAEIEAIAIDEEMSDDESEPLSQNDERSKGPPQELALETIPEERQHLLMSSSVTCPLATPEDTGV